MRTYTLHLPDSALRGDARAFDDAVVVPDGFSWPAFAFSVAWFLYHRLWLSALLVLALLGGLIVGGRVVGISPVAGTVIALLASLLIGLEASSLRRWTYARNGRPARDAVVAASSDEAEAKAVTRWLDPSAAPRPTAPPAPSRRFDDSVIGLFPLSEGHR
ncbi:DUF2628 domain-containing protein [Methylobacterium sp. C25]|uniref:DUF2628 domain-containing protein n=1 Tax=Methylobacterium sp. C25 TaxID=2721622 RepID=UPI001F3EB86F|nr:DUF2628 domain-containing protein [Methylobacterium sp. C25]MCE4222228.1 DUF2628 domain-containing protein [Methylobacterium sp. C25]